MVIPGFDSLAPTIGKSPIREEETQCPITVPTRSVPLLLSRSRWLARHSVARSTVSEMLKRFTIFGKHFAIQGLVFGRPQFFYRYNNGHTAFVDFGPIRFYRHTWRDR